MKRSIVRKLHLWLSIPLGLIITLICITGALLMFERDLGRKGQADVTDPGTAPLPLSQLLERAYEANPTKSDIIGMTIYPQSTHAYKIMLSKPAMAALWQDQYTGEITGQYKRAEIFKVSSSAHRRLFGQLRSTWGNYGKLIVGITTLCIIVIVVTGYIMWFKSGRQRRLTIPLRKGSFQFLHGLHCAGGVYAGIILLICALTGLSWSFDWYKDGLYAIFGTKASGSTRKTEKAVNFEAWQKAFDEVSAAEPDKELRLYQGRIEVVRGGVGNQQAVDIYRFDAESGKITTVEPYSDQEKSRHIKGWIQSLHLGSWGNLVTKIIYFVLALLGGTLPLTGYYLWLHRVKSRKNNGTHAR
ncbi:MAG: PepSY domain-containing protein [Bacteroides sp.]|nr:PepSY domain-containing protein [Bacteroides sp.]